MVQLWNPVAFFISFFMSILMPLIFALPHNMSIENILLYWPLRWLVAYFLINLFVRDLSLYLAKKVFKFNPQ